MISGKILRFVLLFFMLTPLGLMAQMSAVHIVTSNADSGPGSLREAFSLSAPNDTIRFDARGIIKLTSGPLSFNNNINIEGPGPDSLILSGDSTYVVFSFPASNADVNISGLTIQGGRGAGIYIAIAHSINLENMLFRENYGPDGRTAAGAYLWADLVSLKNCTFYKNRISKYTNLDIEGGGALVRADTLAVDSCDFEENLCSNPASNNSSDVYGGGLYFQARSSNSTLTVTNSNFINNWAFNSDTWASGGGLAFKGYSGSSGNNHVILDNCNFAGNRTGGNLQSGSGAYFFLADSVKITNCTFNGNLATNVNNPGNGGAIRAEIRESLIVEDCELIGNNANFGGAIYCRSPFVGVAEMRIENCLFDQNTGSGNGTVYGDQLKNALVKNSRFIDGGGVSVKIEDNEDKFDIRGCEFWNSIGSDILVDGGNANGTNLIENCTFSETNTRSLRFNDASVNSLVKNCAFVDVSNLVTLDNSQLTFKNNIFSHLSTSAPILEPYLFNSSTLLSGGGNVSRTNDLTSYFTAPTDLHSTNPVLVNFGFNGGTTRTYQLNFNSPAINHGGVDTLTTDQRGFIRDSTIDTGPYEFNGVNPSLVVVVSQSNSAVVCEGDSFDLLVGAIGEGPLSYQWQLNGINILGATQNQFPFQPVSVSDAGDYSCIVSNPSSSDTSEVIALTVNPLPTANAGTNQTICLGQSTNLTASGGTTYAWSQGLGSGASQAVAPTTTTSYSVTVTDGNNCSATDNVVVTINPLPTANAGGNQTICVGQSASLTASGGTTYAWSQGLGSGAVQTVAPTTTTTYSVTVTDGNNCSATDNVVVTVNPLPTANAGANQTICVGQNANLTASGGTTYAWSQGLGSGSVQTVAPTSTTTYTVTVTDGNNCSATDNIVVTVNPLPTANAGTNQAICLGQNANLTASGGTTYSWNQGLGSGATQTVAPTTTTTYSVTVTDGNNCSATDNIVVTVNPLPTANAGGNQIICLGQSTNLTASGGMTYSWSQGLGSGATQTVAPTTTTTYSVTVTNANNCSATDNVVVTVNPLPTANAGNDQTICAGQSTSLNAAGGTTYIWNQGLGTGQAQTVSPNSTTTYTVTVTDGNNCSATDDVLITVNPLPAANAGADQAICAGESASLTASGGASYSWNQGLGSGATQTIAPTSTTTYSVTVTDGNNCSATDDVLVTVNPLPVVSFAGLAPLYCTTDAPVILAGSPAGGTFSGPGIVGSNFDPNQAGAGLHDIQYALTDQNGCSDSTTASTEVEICVGLEDQLPQTDPFTIYPNPFANELAIRFLENDQEEWSYHIYDALGKELQLSSFQDGSGVVLDMSQVSSGTYFLILIHGKDRFSHSVTKQKY